MDRSFLSDEQVVAASRQFVCIRLATYEDREEATFLASVFRGRSGQLENTVFGILSPDGKQKLTRSGRGPFFQYRNGSAMAAGMREIAKRYPKAERASGTDQQLPVLKSVDLALNVAACDGLPLIVAYGADAEQLEQVRKAILPLAWDPKLAGQFLFAQTQNPKDLKPIPDAEAKTGIVVVQPDSFGLTGKTLAQLSLPIDTDQAKTKLAEIAAKYPRKSKDTNSHIQLGIGLGIDWKTAIPSTDAQSNRAKERARRDR